MTTTYMGSQDFSKRPLLSEELGKILLAAATRTKSSLMFTRESLLTSSLLGNDRFTRESLTKARGKFTRQEPYADLEFSIDLAGESAIGIIGMSIVVFEDTEKRDRPFADQVHNAIRLEYQNLVSKEEAARGEAEIGDDFDVDEH